ncbi:MAG: hypothetical protein WC042_01215 [Candidatus Paceibacterota bacterium]
MLPPLGLAASKRQQWCYLSALRLSNNTITSLADLKSLSRAWEVLEEILRK